MGIFIIFCLEINCYDYDLKLDFDIDFQVIYYSFTFY